MTDMNVTPGDDPLPLPDVIELGPDEGLLAWSMAGGDIWISFVPVCNPSM